MPRGSLHVGTSGWVYPHWKGTFYPDDLPAGERLPHYAARFSTVEVNHTYYRLLSTNAAQRWLAQVPEDFTFAFKAHRYVTHRKKLRDAGESLRTFLDALAPIERRTSIVLFQLPPFQGFDPGKLDAFLGLLPQDKPYRYAFEFRHDAWNNESTWDILGAHGVAFVVHDFDATWTPIETTADQVYVRFHGPAGPYRGRYTIGALSAWAERIRAWRKQGRDVWCYFNNDQAGFAGWNALELAALCGDPKAAATLDAR